MALKMAKSSLFAILLRSPWWYSAGIGLVIILICMVLVGGSFGILFSTLSLPFLGIAGYAGYKESLRPSRQRIIDIAEKARGMTSKQIADKIAEPYVAARFDSVLFKGNAADLELERGNRKLLVCSKRFKAANTGIEPLKKLVEAGEKIEATGYIYVTLGEISANALSFAAEHDIQLVQATQLAAYFDGQAGID